jgi:Ni,Fe-hydrogenase maturation factor
MTQTKPLCLILACGNTLRGDDGIGPWLADWAEEKFRENPTIRILSRQQWTPDLAEEIADSESVLFIDCSTESAALARELYDSQPRNALLLTVGASSTELGETLSTAVTAALPNACTLLEETVTRLLS